MSNFTGDLSTRGSKRKHRSGCGKNAGGEKVERSRKKVAAEVRCLVGQTTPEGSRNDAIDIKLSTDLAPFKSTLYSPPSELD
jgi:hypothetical protein